MFKYLSSRNLSFLIILVFGIWILTSTLGTKPLNGILISAHPVSVTTIDTTILARSIKKASTIYSKTYISHPGLWLCFVAPSVDFYDDCLDLLLIVTACVIITLTFWNFNYQYPFSKNTVMGFRLLTLVLVLYVIINQTRNDYILDYLKSATGKTFEYNNDNSFVYFCYLLMAIFWRLSVVFNKGRKLQEEHDLTV